MNNYSKIVAPLSNESDSFIFKTFLSCRFFIYILPKFDFFAVSGELELFAEAGEYISSDLFFPLILTCTYKFSFFLRPCLEEFSPLY